MVNPSVLTPKQTFEFKKPASLKDALSILKGNTGNIRVLAGGTDLNLQLRQRPVPPSAVIDVKNIPELNVLEFSGGVLHIGAAVPLSAIITNAAIRENFGLIVQACSVIGSVQIRNRGSMGGNVCNAAPSADSAPALMCLDAVAVITSSTKTRKVNFNEFFVGPGKTVIAPDELLVAIEIPKPPLNSAGFYLRHTTREEMDIAVTGVASFIVTTSDNNKVKEIKIVMGAVASTPLRARAAEALLTGQALTEAAITKAAEAAAKEATPISDVRASADYRRELVKVLTQRTLRQGADKLGLK